MVNSFLLAAAVCMDTYFAAMGCTMAGIRIPRRYSLLVSGIGTGVLGLSFALSSLLQGLLPGVIFRLGGALLLAAMGLWSIAKAAIPALFEGGRSIRIRFKGLELAVQIAFDETKADQDGSKSLNFREAAAFSTAMSLDSLVSGMGAALCGKERVFCLFVCFLLGVAAVLLGISTGNCGKRTPCPSWIGGAMLLLLSILRLI